MERDAGFGGHRLGEVGLAGSRRAFEEDAASWLAAHHLLERLRREEEVHRVDGLALGLLGADHVIESDLGVLGAEHGVR